MLASKDPNLFNGNMETRSAPASHPAGRPAAAADWRPAPGIIDRMLAYRDWWNIPASRGGQSRRPSRGRVRPAGSEPGRDPLPG